MPPGSADAPAAASRESAAMTARDDAADRWLRRGREPLDAVHDCEVNLEADIGIMALHQTLDRRPRDRITPPMAGRSSRWPRPWRGWRRARPTQHP